MSSARRFEILVRLIVIFYVLYVYLWAHTYSHFYTNFLFSDFINDLDDDDASEIEFNESDEEDMEDEPKKKKSKKWQVKGDDIKSLFASADEFASILDEEPDFMAGTSHAVSNKDKAGREPFLLKKKNLYYMIRS